MIFYCTPLLYFELYDSMMYDLNLLVLLALLLKPINSSENSDNIFT